MLVGAEGGHKNKKEECMTEKKKIDPLDVMRSHLRKDLQLQIQARANLMKQLSIVDGSITYIQNKILALEPPKEK